MSLLPGLRFVLQFLGVFSWPVALLEDIAAHMHTSRHKEGWFTVTFPAAARSGAPCLTQSGALTGVTVEDAAFSLTE